ncbi:MAG: YafY family transcriptional regulator [Proteobacteria bacterium]|nr:YafY family transcriptional regulator [Pseudomonadota bacterium]
MRLERLLSIVIILLTRRRVTAQTLAERFNVTVRTIYRDIRAIDAAGIPIVTHQGQGGGFEIMENYRLNRQVLTLKDMVALVSTLQGISPILGSDDLQNAVEKIESLVPGENRGELDERQQQIAIDILPWGPQDYLKALFQHINAAIADRCLVSFTYRDQNYHSTSRTIEPMTLIFKGSSWYLFGFCRKRDDYRTFRLGRMQDLSVLPETFTRREGSHRDYMDPQTTLPSVRFTLRFDKSAREAAESFFGPDNISVDRKGCFIGQTELPDSAWLDSFVLSFGDKAEVLEPKVLRNRIAKKIKKMQALYQT